MKSKFDLTLTIALGALFVFVILARAAHDRWAATIVSLSLILMSAVFIIERVFVSKKPIYFLGFWAIVAIGIFSTLSLLNAANKEEAIFRLINNGSVGLLFLISVNIFRDETKISYFVHIAALVIIFQTPIHFFQLIKMGWTDKPYGTLINSNLSVLFHLMWIPILWGYREKSRILKFVGVAAVCNIFLSRSTFGVVFFILTIPILFGLRNITSLRIKYRRQFNVVFSLGLMTVVVLLALKFYEMSSGHVLGMKSVHYTSRMLWWKSGWAMFTDYPWFGIGLGNYTHAYLAYKVGEGFNTLYAHSAVVTILAETGIVGFSAALAILWSWVRKYRNSDFNLQNQIFFTASMFGIFFILFNIGIEYLGIMMLLSIFMALSIPWECSVQLKLKPIFGVLILVLLLTAVPYTVSPIMAKSKTSAGIIEQNNGEYQKAINSFLTAVRLNPFANEPYYRLASTYVNRFVIEKKTEDLEWAVTYQQQAVKLNPFSAHLWWQLARYYEAAQDWSQAEHAFERAARNDISSKFYSRELEQFKQRRKS